MRSDRQNHLKAFIGLHHYPQKRKYTGEPYTVHLVAVAEMADKYNLQMGYEISLCHDLLEDTKCTEQELYEALIRFRYDMSEARFICIGVSELTDEYTKENFPQFNRKERKELECLRLNKISSNSQSIKYCDLIDNTSSIVKHDEGFAKVYLSEKSDLLKIMDKGNKILYKKALKQLS